MTGTPDTSVEITRQTRARWMRIRRYLREVYDQLKVVLSLEIRQVKTEATGVVLHGCSTWTLRQEHYSKPGPYTTGACFTPLGHNARDQITK